MKNKLIASIITLTVLGGAVIPTFAAVKENSQGKSNVKVIKVENSSNVNSYQNNRCSVSGSLLQGLTFKKIWLGYGSCGSIIIRGTVDKPNHGSNNNETMFN